MDTEELKKQLEAAKVEKKNQKEINRLSKKKQKERVVKDKEQAEEYYKINNKAEGIGLDPNRVPEFSYCEDCLTRVDDDNVEEYFRLFPAQDVPEVDVKRDYDSYQEADDLGDSLEGTSDW